MHADGRRHVCGLLARRGHVPARAQKRSLGLPSHTLSHPFRAPHPNMACNQCREPCSPTEPTVRISSGTVAQRLPLSYVPRSNFKLYALSTYKGERLAASQSIFHSQNALGTFGHFSRTTKFLTFHPLQRPGGRST